MAKVLVIEDSPEVRENVLEILELEGYETLGAQNGQEGIALIATEHPDLIICDVMMPELDGYGVLRALRQPEKQGHNFEVPFIFLTAKSESEDMRQGMGLGADDYLTKPFSPKALVDAVAVRLKMQEFHRQKVSRVATEVSQDILDEMPTGLDDDMNRLTKLSRFLRRYHTALDSRKLGVLLGELEELSQHLEQVVSGFTGRVQLRSILGHHPEGESGDGPSRSHLRRVFQRWWERDYGMVQASCPIDFENMANYEVMLPERILEKVLEAALEAIFARNQTTFSVQISAQTFGPWISVYLVSQPIRQGGVLLRSTAATGIGQRWQEASTDLEVPHSLLKKYQGELEMREAGNGQIIMRLLLPQEVTGAAPVTALVPQPAAVTGQR